MGIEPDIICRKCKQACSEKVVDERFQVSSCCGAYVDIYGGEEYTVHPSLIAPREEETR